VHRGNVDSSRVRRRSLSQSPSSDPAVPFLQLQGPGAGEEAARGPLRVRCHGDEAGGQCECAQRCATCCGCMLEGAHQHQCTSHEGGHSHRGTAQITDSENICWRETFRIASIWEPSRLRNMTEAHRDGFLKALSLTTKGDEIRGQS
jgi:hypothetical protein